MKNLYSSYSSFLNYLHSLSFVFGKGKLTTFLGLKTTTINNTSTSRTLCRVFFILLVIFSLANQDLFGQSVSCTGKSNFVVWNGSNQTLYLGGYGGQTPSEVVYDNKLWEGISNEYQWYNHQGVPGVFARWVLQGTCAPTCTNASISSNPSTSSVSRCQGTSFSSLSVSASGSATLSYQWKSSSTSGGSYSNISGATSSSYTPPNNIVGTKYYKCTVTSSCNGSTATSNASGARTVTAAPSAGTLSGTQGICVSGSTTFSSTVSGGTWSSGNTGIATINSSSGAISGVSAGTATITYTKAGSGGCSNATATRTVTVTAAPSAGTLSGTQGICVSGSTTFSSTVSGGTWSSGNTGIATINSSSGAISGVSAGTATITYTKAGSGGCSNATATRTVTVTAAPSAGTLSGTQGICVSGSTTFSSTVSGGTWSSGNTGIATINSSSGAISGVSAGTATITYTKAGSGGCSDATATRTVTVTAAPSAGTLSGTQGICVSGSTTFSSTVSGGTWSSGNTGIATINSSSGAISGVSAGTATITYTKAGSGGCSNATATRTVTVTAAPSAGTLSGTQGICVSGSTTFSSTVSGGTWSSGNTGIATINSSSGAISGVSAGTATITYTKTGSGGCSNATATRTVTVTASPSAGTLSGTQGICVSGSTTFSSTVSGGTWISGNTGIATINSSSGAISGVSAGTATITYTKTGSGGCSNATATRTVTVNARPTVNGPINGSRTGTGTVVIQATASTGSIDWYAASLGGSSLGNSASAVNWTTPSISSTTIYYAEANNGTCTSASRTAVIATILGSTDVSGRFVLKNNTYMVLNTVETTGEVFVVLDNDDANALSTGGNIITKHEKNQIKWNIGTNTGNYTIPFTAPNNAKTKIPFSLEITEAGTGSGNIKFSSYTDNDGTNNYKVSDYKPSDVANMDDGGDEDNSVNIINRFWIVDANGYDTDQKPAATLSFNYADHELSSGNNNIAEANIFPQRWNSTASQWHDVTLSGTSDATNNKLSGVTVAKENFFRSWALVSSVTPLPVELIYFDVKRTGSFVLLEWETLAEINNDYFIVEKSSDGENWEEILTVDGQGNTNEQTYYSQIDVNGCEGICYYRLIQVDFDGRREKEGIRFLNSDNQNQEFKMTVIPNPMNQRANISFSALEGGVFNLSVLNQTGQEVYSTKTIGDKGNNQISFDSSTLSHGSYYFILEDESGNRIQQLVIK